MRHGKPSEKRRSPGRRNLSAVAEAIGLPEGYDVTKYAKGDVCDRAWVERREVRDRECPRCGARGHVNGHARTRVWHVPRGGRQLCLLLHQVRMRCPKCGRCWSDGHEDLLSDVSKHMTRDVAAGIEDDLMLRKSVKECTVIWGPSRHLVNKVLERAFVDWQYLPATLCIDEFKADTDAGKMAVGIYDGDAGRIVEVLPDMDRETIDWFFDGFGEEERSQVQYFTCDMSPEMIAVQRRWFPQAKLCIDRFHVIKLANKCLSDVRKRVQADESVDPILRQELRRGWKLLTMGRDRVRAVDDEYAAELAERRAKAQEAMGLTDEELDGIRSLRAREPRARKLERLLSASDELKVAYGLAHSLRRIHRVGRERWWDGMPGELAKWCSLGIASHVPEVETCARTIKRNREGILNSYRHGRTNAVAEGVNNSIKVTKRRG